MSILIVYLADSRSFLDYLGISDYKNSNAGICIHANKKIFLVVNFP